MNNPDTSAQTSKNSPAGGKKTWIAVGAVALLIVAVSGFIYLKIVQKRIYDEDAEIVAPKIELIPQKSGILQEIFASGGESVPADFVVARVSDELIKTRVPGLITSVNKNIGKQINVNLSESVATMINPKDLRVVARVEENKGLDQIEVGQTVIFTVDAFDRKEFRGIVDEVSPASRESALTFNISSQRPTKEFDVKVRFNIDEYPHLKNGMSAKVWIYK